PGTQEESAIADRVQRAAALDQLADLDCQMAALAPVVAQLAHIGPALDLVFRRAPDRGILRQAEAAGKPVPAARAKNEAVARAGQPKIRRNQRPLAEKARRLRPGPQAELGAQPIAMAGREFRRERGQ